MHPAVVSVECREDYILSIVFDNGECGLLDMKPYLNHGVFKKYKIQASSKRFMSRLTLLHGNPGLTLIRSLFARSAASYKEAL